MAFVFKSKDRSYFKCSVFIQEVNGRASIKVEAEDKFIERTIHMTKKQWSSKESRIKEIKANVADMIMEGYSF